MEVSYYLRALWKWRWLIALATATGLIFSALAESQAPRVYRSSTTLMVGQFLQTANPQQSDFALGQQLAQSYAMMVRRPAILEAVVDSLNITTPPGRLASQVSTTALPNTQLIQIDVVDGDPTRAVQIANEVAQQLILQSPTPQQREQQQNADFVARQLVSLQARLEDASKQQQELDQRLAKETSARSVQDIQNQLVAIEQKIAAWQATYAGLLGSYQGGRVNYLSVVEPAVTAAPIGSPIPLLSITVLVATMAGFCLAAAAALFLEYIDDTLKSSEDTERALGLPVVATVERLRGIRTPPNQLAMLQQPRSAVSESYRLLCTNIQFRAVTAPVTSLMIAGAIPGEGKTTTASNLAVALAQAGQRVILCDGDLRRPSVHRLFDLSPEVGLTSLLLDHNLPLRAALADGPVENLWILPSGPLPPNPGELLGSAEMRERVNQMHEAADLIVFDSPALLGVADAAILATLASGIILVVAGGRTRGELVRRAKETLDQVGRPILGVVLNKMSPRRNRVYDYYRTAAVDPRLKLQEQKPERN